MIDHDALARLVNSRARHAPWWKRWQPVAVLVVASVVLFVVLFGNGSSPGADAPFRVSGEVIQEPGQRARVAAEGVLLSDPPGGGIVDLDGFSWDSTSFTDHSEGVRSSNQALTIYGDWNGDQLEVTSVREPADDGWSTKFSIERDQACSTDPDLAPFYELDHDDIGVLYWSEIVDADGVCALRIRAIANSLVLDQSLAPVESRASVVPIVESN